MSFYRNREGYFDPTAGEALSRIRKQEKQWSRRTYRKKDRRKETHHRDGNREKRASPDGPVAKPC